MVLALSQQLAESQKQYAKPTGEHISLGRGLRGVLFGVPIAIFALLLYLAVVNGALQDKTAIITAVIVAVLWGIVVSGVRIAAQWERGVVLRLGNFQAVRGTGASLHYPHHRVCAIHRHPHTGSEHPAPEGNHARQRASRNRRGALFHG